MSLDLTDEALERFLEDEEDDFDMKDLDVPRVLKWSVNFIKATARPWQQAIYTVDATDRDQATEIGWQKLKAEAPRNWKRYHVYSVDLIPGQIKEDEDDEDYVDMKELDVRVNLSAGTRVKVLTGKYTGEEGTVVYKGHMGNNVWGFYVRLDGFDNPSDSVLYHPNSLEVLRHSKFPLGTRVKILVGKYAGQLGYVTGGGRQVYVHPAIDDDPEDPETLWTTYPYDQNELEYLRDDKVEQVVNRLVEDDDDDDIDIDMKGFLLNVAEQCSNALKAAGFEVVQAERRGEELFLKFSWPAGNGPAYINGWRRAQGILKEILVDLDHHDYTVQKIGPRPDTIAFAFVRKRLLNDPHLWKFERIPNYYDNRANVPDPAAAQQTPGVYKIFFNGSQAGTIMCSQGLETATRIKREMEQLHEVFPFTPQGWQWEGDVWGNGPAVLWWRTNRDKLGDESRRNNAYFDDGMRQHN